MVPGFDEICNNYGFEDKGETVSVFNANRAYEISTY